jgi:hypothetical protein
MSDWTPVAPAADIEPGGFRTVDVEDVIEGRGAPLVDVECTGTSIRDFRGLVDGEQLSEELVVSIYGAPPEGAVLVYEPPVTDQR